MNNATAILQTKIKSVISGLVFVHSLGKEAYERYWGTSANTDITSYGDTDAITVASKLKKSEFISGISMAEAVKKFFGNEAVSNAAYLQTARNMTLGDNAAAFAVSQEVESIGDMLKDLGSNMIEMRKQALSALELYTSSEISAAVAGISTTTVVFGCDVTKNQLIAGVTLLEQFIKLCDSNSPTQGDYKATLAAWEPIV